MKMKDFDAVQMMREIRENIQKKYENAPEKREADLDAIKQKYSPFIRKHPFGNSTV